MNKLEDAYINLLSRPSIIETLLRDNTTKSNIIWATDSYTTKGYRFNDQITSFHLLNSNLIIPRSKKTKDEQTKRSKNSGEVFTPSWMCNKQNNLIDKSWLKKDCCFNVERGTSWVTNKNKIEFANRKTWINYVSDIRIEISCGEAPYIVSRYDTITGKEIELISRIGLLDRKMRVINENVDTKEDWLRFSIIALKSVYGYEWQGDNLILARINVFYTFLDYYYNRFFEFPSNDVLIEIASIISWNFWQMDGIKCVIPNSCVNDTFMQPDLYTEECEAKICIGCKNNDLKKHNGKYCYIMNWKKNKKEKYISQLR